ncbi:MAG: hypothetical protein K2P86_10010 [Xanthobacteraceae bacterium]|nr:hypothetical protein [Xanthobacteraceae bacterium]
MNTKKRAAFAVRSLFAGLLVVVAFAGVSAIAQQQPQFVPQAEDPDNFPAGPGRDDAFYACAGCHAFRLVANQGLTRERWNETINYMTERHGMPKLEGKDRELILNYLAKTYPPKQEQNRQFQNPFLKQ